MNKTTETAVLPLIVANDTLNDAQAMRAKLKSHGYLFFKGIGPKDRVRQTRRDVLTICREAGWVSKDHELMDGIWSGVGPFTENEPPYMAVYKQILHTPSFVDLPTDPIFFDIMGKILQGPVLLHNRRIGRVTFPSNTTQTTAAHQDFHYIRGSTETYTIWMPLGDTPMELGGLKVLDRSNQNGFIDHVIFQGLKYAASGLGPEQLEKTGGTEWHAADYEIGDFLILHSHTVHAALPNLTPNRLRLSTDNRYQLEGTDIHPGALGTHYNL